MPIERQRMFRNIKATLSCDTLLALFDFFIEKFFDPSTIETDQVIVVRSFVEFENRLASFEVIAMQQSGLLKLGQHTVYRGQADIHILGQQDFIHILGAQMAYLAALKNLENLESRQGRFQAARFQFGRVTGHVVGRI
jgi:hypothetical protein